MVIGTIKSYLCGKSFDNLFPIQAIENKVYQSELQDVLNRLPASLNGNSRQLLKCITESLVWFNVGRTSLMDRAGDLDYKIISSFNKIVNPLKMYIPMPLLLDAMLASGVLLTFDCDRTDINPLTEKDFDLDNSPTFDPPSVVNEKTKLLTLWNEWERFTPHQKMRGMIFAQFLDWAFLAYRQDTARQLYYLCFDLADYKCPLTVQVFGFLPQYVEAQFHSILVFLSSWVSIPDVLDEGESCAIGSLCCQKSRYMSFRLFAAAMHRWVNSIKKPTLIEFAFQHMELDPELYTEMIQNYELKEFVSFTFNFKPPAPLVNSPDYDEFFSLDVPFSATPYMESFYEFYKIKNDMKF